ncbi:MAG: hypothetical protein BGO48_07005 [Mucilaginibacter sp. 44-25]|nr:MAG: hypothetical protein BGO48_07005 [Mucilaginibacter sp. 44-25]
MNTAVTGKGKLILTSWVKKSRATATSPITIDNFAVSLYMETAELAVYLNWIKDLSQFATYRIKSQVTPFDETWGLVENGPKFQYYTVTFKVLNNYMLNAPQVTSYKPITYSVELRRFYKP